MQETLNNPIAVMFTNSVVAFFIVFARCGACIIVSAFSSSARIPVSFRLGLAVALTFVIMTKFAGLPYEPSRELLPNALVLATETAFGFFIGFLSRFYVFIVEMFAAVISTAIGISSVFANLTAEAESLPALATLFSLGFMTLLFATDLHHDIIRALSQSYDIFPPGDFISPNVMLMKIEDELLVASRSALHLAMPFLAYTLLANAAVNLAVRFVPQIQVNYALNPLIILAGIVLMYFLAPVMMYFISASYASYLRGL